MNLDDISVYLQVIASGSLSRAAKVLRRPKATVSHQLKRLEDELGTLLFLRSANQMTLNEAGRGFFEHAQAIRRACERAADSTQQSKSAAEGVLNVASSSEFASNLISPILLHLTRAKPNLRLNVMTFQREVLAEVREQYDCILYLNDPPLPQFSNMSARLLGRFRFGLYASSKYLSRKGPPKLPKDLMSHDLLGFHDGMSLAAWNLTDGSRDFSIRPDTSLLSNDYWVVKLSAIHDRGICFLPEFFAGLEERSGLLNRVLPEWSSREIPVYALFWSHRFANPNLRLLIETATKQFEEINSYTYEASRRESLSQPG